LLYCYLKNKGRGVLSFIDWILFLIIGVLPLLVLVSVMLSGVIETKKEPPLRFSDFTATVKAEKNKKD
jgi:ABC-type lipoprotein release transport system permease subunit